MSGKKGRNSVWKGPLLVELESYVVAGLNDEQIGRKLKRSANAIKIARQRHLGIRAAERAALSDTKNCRQVAALLGLGCAKSVTAWIANGWLTADRWIRSGANFQWKIADEDLLAFLADPAKVRDADWRAWAIDVRAGVTYLTTGQVAERYAVGFKTVYQWIRKGELPAFRHANWMVRESDLAGFIPPCERQPVRPAGITFVHGIVRAGRLFWRVA